jgi:GNAT superfamily N-acetyltransferase
MLIRDLDPHLDLGAVEALYLDAAAFWIMSDRKPPDRAKAEAFFIDCPPGCDPALSQRLGLFENDRLIGVAELSFGFPESNDAYLGLMLLAPAARGRGLGGWLVTRIEERARKQGSHRLCLGVLEENTAGRAFWDRQGFVPTGVSRFDEETGHLIHRLQKPVCTNV